MWAVSGQTLTMTERDWGVELPIRINGATFSERDEVHLTIKTSQNGKAVIKKIFSNITQNTVKLTFTKEESTALKAGNYVYTLDWYQEGTFLCNIIPSAVFKVVDKA